MWIEPGTAPIQRMLTRCKTDAKRWVSGWDEIESGPASGCALVADRGPRRTRPLSSSPPSPTTSSSSPRALRSSGIDLHNSWSRCHFSGRMGAESLPCNSRHSETRARRSAANCWMVRSIAKLRSRSSYANTAELSLRREPSILIFPARPSRVVQLGPEYTSPQSLTTTDASRVIARS